MIMKLADAGGLSTQVRFILSFNDFSSLRHRLSRPVEKWESCSWISTFLPSQVLLRTFDFQFDQKQPELWKCGNLAALARFPRSCGKGGKPALGFPGFPQLRHFHSSPGLFSRCSPCRQLALNPLAFSQQLAFGLAH